MTLVRIVGAGLALMAAVPASAQEGPQLAFDPETCSFGAAFDAAFLDLQREQEARLEERGYLYRHADEELGETTQINRAMAGRYGAMTVSAIGIDFDRRYVYFKEGLEPLIAEAERVGLARDGALIETEAVAENAANLFSTADYAYNSETGKTEMVFDPLGRSGFGCSLGQARRIAGEEGLTLEELARFRPDKRIWSKAIAALHQQDLDARSRGDYDKALGAAQQLVERLDAGTGGGGVEYAYALDSLGTALSDLGRKREALAIFERARDLVADKLGIRHPIVIAIQAHYAETLNAVIPGDEQAWWQLNFVRYYYVDLFGQEDPRSLAAANALGVATGDLVRREREGMLDLSDARYDLELALEQSGKINGEDHPETASLRQNLALVLAEMDELVDAVTLTHRTLQQRGDLYGMGHPATLETLSIETDMMLRVPQGRVPALVPARYLAHELRARRARLASSSSDEAQRAREIGQQRRDFQALAEAAWWASRAGEQDPQDLREEALLALQDSMEGSADRAVALTAARRAAEAEGEGLGELAAERQALSDEWGLIEQAATRLLAEPGSAGQRATLGQRRAAVEQRIAKIDARLQREAPAYFAFTRPQALALSEVQAMLAPDEAVLLAVPTRYGTHMMAVSQDAIGWHRSQLDEVGLGKRVTRLLWDVGANVDVSPAQSQIWQREGEGAYPFDRGTAFALYRDLVAPLDAVLAGKEHVFVASAGSLSSLPLALLVTEQPQGQDGDPSALRETHWLADRFALVQIPSIAALKALRGIVRKDDREKAASFKGFGDPVLLGSGVARGGSRLARRSGGGTAALASYFAKGTRSGERRLADVDSLRSLARLPGTAREIASLAQAFDAQPGDVFTEARATETNLRAIDLSQIGVLALATHGLVAGEADGYSEPGLVFTPPMEARVEDDGLLTTSEIAALRMDAEWVILSACNTAGGDGEAGAPGLSGLARAFFYAGARNILASHWPVRDDIAPRITVRTVELRQQNPEMSRAQAFRQALREVRNDPAADSEDDTWAHPSAWAPFVLIGDR